MHTKETIGSQRGLHDVSITTEESELPEGRHGSVKPSFSRQSKRFNMAQKCASSILNDMAPRMLPEPYPKRSYTSLGYHDVSIPTGDSELPVRRHGIIKPSSSRESKRFNMAQKCATSILNDMAPRMLR